MDFKGPKIFGKTPRFFEGNYNRIFDSAWNKTLFQPVLNEIALAVAYSVPCYGDARNYYITNANSDVAAVAHLFLFDFSLPHSAHSFHLGNPHLPAKDKLKTQLKNIILDILVCFMSQEEYLEICQNTEVIMKILNIEEKNAKEILEEELALIEYIKRLEQLYEDEAPRKEILEFKRQHSINAKETKFSKFEIANYIFNHILEIEPMLNEALDFVQDRIQERNSVQLNDVLSSLNQLSQESYANEVLTTQSVAPTLFSVDTAREKTQQTINKRKGETENTNSVIKKRKIEAPISTSGGIGSALI